LKITAANYSIGVGRANLMCRSIMKAIDDLGGLFCASLLDRAGAASVEGGRPSSEVD
jgi:hypothetical protein